MSDRDLFGLDDEDSLFGPEDDDLFGAEDGGGSFDWNGSDDEEYSSFEDGDFGLNLGDESADTPEFSDEFSADESESGGTIFGLNRIFVILAAVILVILCLTMGVVGVLLFSNRGPSEVQQTVTAVYMTNTYVAFALAETETQNAVIANETATAESWTATPSPVPTDTPEPTATPTTEPPPSAVFHTPTPDSQANIGEGTEVSGDGSGGGGLGAEGVAGTATALAEILLGGSQATPTVEGADGAGGFITPTPATGTGGAMILPTAMPNTGLFDDGFAGGNGVDGLIAAMFVALGLGAVVVVSRWLRTH